MSNFPFTKAISTTLNTWGWRFVGLNPVTDWEWRKYENDICVASFPGDAWDRDIKDAHRITMEPVEYQPLSQAVVDLLEVLGWEWTMTGQEVWEWIRFNGDRMAAARQGGDYWHADVKACELQAAKDIGIWTAVPEMRYELAFPKGPSLQQKWVRQWPMP